MIKHTTIWVRDDEWDKINYLCADSGVFPSRWIATKVMKYAEEHPDAVPPAIEREYNPRGLGSKGKLGRSRSLAFQDWELEKMKDMAVKAGMTLSNYILAVIFNT